MQVYIQVKEFVGESTRFMNELMDSHLKIWQELSKIDITDECFTDEERGGNRNVIPNILVGDELEFYERISSNPWYIENLFSRNKDTYARLKKQFELANWHGDSMVIGRVTKRRVVPGESLTLFVETI